MKKAKWVLILATLLGALALAAGLREPAYSIRMLAADPNGGGDATLSPDGKSFVISSRRAGQWDLWNFDIEASRWQRLTDNPAEDFEARWSPDGRRLAFTSTRDGGKNIWILELDGGALSQLTSGGIEQEYPDWSPNGDNVVYTAGPWGKRDIFMHALDGSERRRLTRRPTRLGACAFEADGDSLVCHNYEHGSGNIERLWLDGESAPLTLGGDWDYKPTSSPRDGWIAFSRASEGPSDIWVIPAAGGRAMQLTSSQSADRWPTWDAAGERLFFHRMVENGTGITLWERSTGETRRLVGKDESPLQASLSPDGRSLAYCYQDDEGRRLRILNLDRPGEPRGLTTGGGEACYPRWSPDGRWIAFASKPAGHPRWEVAIARPDGGDLTLLTSGVDGLRGLDGPVDWSPDSTSIVFHSDTLPFEADLYSIEIATGELRRLTDDVWFDEAPSFTPDGEGVLFMSTRGGGWTWGLYRLSLEDGTVDLLEGPDYTERNFVRMGPAGETVWSMATEDGRGVVRKPVDGAPEPISSERDARWPELSADGERLIYTSLESRVEYWLVEHPFGKGSPLERQLRARAETPDAPSRPARPADRASAAAVAISPVDLHHR